MDRQTTEPVIAEWEVSEDGELEVLVDFLPFLSELKLSFLDRLPYEEIVSLIRILGEQMASGSRLEFIIYNLAPVAQAYLANRSITKEMSDSIFYNHKASVWDEGTIAQLLLISGFTKVWTGSDPSLRQDEILVKAIKA